MRTDRIDFAITAVDRAGPLARDVTVRITNVTDDSLDDVRLGLLVACDGTKLGEFRASIGTLASGEDRKLTRTISVTPSEALSVKAKGAKLLLIVRADDELEQATASLSL